MITYKYIDKDMIWVKVIDDTQKNNEFVNTQNNQAYLAWLAEGNLPRPADFVEPLPTASVTPLPAEGTE